MSEENPTSFKQRLQNLLQALPAWKAKSLALLARTKSDVLLPTFEKIRAQFKNRANPFTRQNFAALLQSVRNLDREKFRTLSRIIGGKIKALTQAAQFHLKNPKLLTAKLQQIDVRQWAEKISTSFQKQGTSFYSTLVAVVLSTYFISGPLALLIGRFIPEPPTVKMARTSDRGKTARSLNDYQIIFTRNLFSSRGIIPGEEATPTGQPQDQGGPPVRTTLPFNLIGTLILRDEFRSLATIEDKSASLVYPVRSEDEIPGKARIIKIDPTRVTFLNLSSGRREFIELPEDTNAGGPKITVGAPKKLSVGGGIEKVSPNQFNVARTEVDKAMADLNNILTQARAVPNFENGVPAGYSLFQIVPGSIYDKLGLQNGDVIMGLNGQPISDPGKAFEMLSELKTANHMELQVKRSGKVSTHAYEIR
ncbi:type II secretion system protein GspC [Bdellovibrionota bacterium FG-2]